MNHNIGEIAMAKPFHKLTGRDWASIAISVGAAVILATVGALALNQFFGSWK